MDPIRILILTANPALSGHAPLRVDAEVRLIEEALQRSKYRDRFQVEAKLAVRTTDLRRALLDYRPQIVHFSGHGTGEMGLVLETDTGQQQIVRTEALTQLFGVFDTGEIECVLLNACYSEVQANAIHQFVDCVIGMNQPIGDQAAVEFSEGFYDALGAGRLYDQAFKVGCSAIALAGSRDDSIPVLKYRKRPEAAPSSAQLSAAQSSAAPAPETTAAQTPPSPPDRPSQSQSIGNITISGNHNPFNAVQASGNVAISQNQTQTETASSPSMQAAIEAVDRLKQAIAASDDIDETEQAMAAIPIQKLAVELQKTPPSWSAINKTAATLQKTLDGTATLAQPMATLITLLSQAEAS
jgi:hypothetical protein